MKALPGHEGPRGQDGQPLSATLCAVRGGAAAGMFAIGGTAVLSVIPPHAQASLSFGTKVRPTIALGLMSVALW